MRKLILAATIAALPFFTLAADDELAGMYRLVSSTRTILDTGEVLDTWGKNPNGLIIYGKDGRMLILIVARQPKPESVDKITDQQRLDLHRSMTAYGGTYKFDGKRVEHNIDISWNEVFTGTTLVREITKDGDRLMYTSPPARFSGDGRMSQNTFSWRGKRRSSDRPCCGARVSSWALLRHPPMLNRCASFDQQPRFEGEWPTMGS